MISKPSRLALSGLAFVCAAIFAACNCAPTLRYVTVAPTNGTIYVSAQGDAGVKGARRGARVSRPTARPMTRPSTQGGRKAAVRPQDITTAVCGTLQYSATGYYSNGTTQDQTSAVTWSSSNTSAAGIDNTGLATGVALGFSNIGATLAGITSSTVPLEVDQLNSITVASDGTSVAVGDTTVYTATGNFTLAADGSSTTQDISSQVTWGTDDPDTATVDSSGNVTGVAAGTTNVTAASCDGVIIGSASVTVTGGPKSGGLQLVPQNPTASVGTTIQFGAVQLNSDSSTTPLPSGSVLAWTSDNTGVVTIDPVSGLAQAVSAGTANITGTVSAPPSVAGLSGTTKVTVQAAAARFAYIGNVTGGTGSGTISSYTVDVTSSTPLTPLATIAASTPQQVLLHPSGDLLYYIDSAGALHSEFVNSTNGSLTMTPRAPTKATSNPNTVSDLYAGVIDPTGRFVYVITQGTSEIYGFTITHTSPSGGTGDAALTAISSVVAYNDGTLNGPTWILTDRTGKYLYVVNSGDGTNPGTVSQFTIDQTTGGLTPIGTPINAGVSPLYATVDANSHLYVANEGGANESVSGYTIGSGGALTSVGADTVIAGASDTINVITDPTGKYLYILDFGSSGPGQVFAFSLNTSTGVIGSQIGTPQPTDISPTGMAIDPTGVLLAVDNFDAADISLYTVGSDGSLTTTTPPSVAAGSGAEFVVFYTAASGQ
jgi:6-phosphogluconolactonase (cycloisomerase 2 family)